MNYDSSKSEFHAENVQFRADAPDRSTEAPAHRTADQAVDWPQRAEAFREKEWQLATQMLDAAMGAVDQCARHPNRISLYSALRMLELSSQLGRRAVGLPVDGKEPPAPPAPRPIVPGLEEALNKIYGNPTQPPQEPTDCHS